MTPREQLTTALGLATGYALIVAAITLAAAVPIAIAWWLL